MVVGAEADAVKVKASRDDSSDNSSSNSSNSSSSNNNNNYNKLQQSFRNSELG